MYSFSAYFKKVGKNQYIFTNNPVFSSYGYLVTLDEKRALENQGHIFMKAVITISSGCGVFMLITPKIGFPLYFSLCFLAYLHYKKGFKKIIPVPQKIYCGRRSYFSFYSTNAHIFSWLRVRKFIFSSIIMLLVSASLIYQYLEKPSYFHSFTFLGVCLLCVIVYSKIKQQK